MDWEERIDALASEVFSVRSLRPFQKLTILRIVEHDTELSDHLGTVVILPTGGGKSLCFMLPALLVEGLSLLVYPLRSLMNDQMRRLQAANISSICIQGGQSRKERAALFDRLKTGTVSVVVTNAECLMQSQVLSALGQYQISLLVLDEAHTIVSWGENFRPVLSSLASVVKHLRIRQVLCFTATADHHVLEGLNRLFFVGGKPHYIRASSDRENISYHVVRTLSKVHTLGRLLALPQLRPALVFCARRDTAESACRSVLIMHPELEVRYYHAGLGHNQRKQLETWFACSKCGVLFATKAFGMGIDVRAIRSVIHLDLSEDVVSFLQESGRAGRDGRQSRSIVLLDGHEQNDSVLVRLFSNTDVCYRSSLLALLDEPIEYCHGCDVCNSTTMQQREGERALLEAIALHPFRYSRSSLARLLTTRHGESSFAGTLRSWQESHVQNAVSLLIKEEVVKTSSHRLYLSLRTTLSILTTLLSSLKL